jgi:predicted nuclease of predicted toxin-antitoxin system
MRFLLDQDVYAATARFLVRLGHDVQTAAQAGMAQAADVALLEAAARDRRVLVTRDRDFGGLVFLRHLGAGVVYLRVSPASVDDVHEELATVLASYTQDELHTAFVVVEAGRHRFRRLSGHA